MSDAARKLARTQSDFYMKCESYVGFNRATSRPFEDLITAGQATLIDSIPVAEARFSAISVNECISHDMSFSPQRANLIILFREQSNAIVVMPAPPGSGESVCRKGSISIIDLSMGAVIGLRGEINALCFHAPAELLGEVMQLSDEITTSGLCPAWNVQDDIIANIGEALTTLFQDRAINPDVLFPYFSVAICAHLLHCYGARATGDLH